MNTNLNNIVLYPKDKEKLLKNLHYLGLIGTVLSYGMGLKTYANSINRTGNLEKKSDLPTASWQKLIINLILTDSSLLIPAPYKFNIITKIIIILFLT